METQEIFKRCFVIGPMKDMTKLRILADEVIKPILEPRGFKIITPDEGSIGSIMDQVLLNLEQADILVADITGNNPNVMYELGIYHSFGKPSLVLKDKSQIIESELTPFDIAAYRYLEINLDDVAFSKKILQPKLDEIIENLGELDWFPNPVTKFYNSPVAEIPTAVGLSKNYIKNFMGMILPDIFRKYEDNDNFQLKISVEDENKNFVLLDNAAREKLKFEVLIPQKMKMAKHGYIIDLKQGKMLNYRNAKVFRQSREFNMHIRFEEDGTPVLADIPTVLATLNDSIQHRRGLKATQIDNKEWLILEAQELERFATKCEQFIKKLENESPSIRTKMNIVWRWNPEE